MTASPKQKPLPLGVVFVLVMRSAHEPGAPKAHTLWSFAICGGAHGDEYPARRSGSLLTRRRAWVYSPKAKFPYYFPTTPIRGWFLFWRCAPRTNPARRKRTPFGVLRSAGRAWVRIRHSEIGERLAPQGIHQAESARIFAEGEIPVRVTTAAASAFRREARRRRR